MARLFLDTSALVKLYRSEPDSPAVRACVSPADELLIAPIAPLEFHSAFFGLVRQRLIVPHEAASFLAAFAADRAQYVVLSPTDGTLRRAQSLLGAWAVNEGLRPLDSIQLASALEAHALMPLDGFVTTDAVLAAVARASGLAVRP